MSSSNFALDAKRHELYKSGTNNEPVILDGSLFIRDKVTDVLMMIPDTLETRQFFNLSTVSNNSDKDTCDTQENSNRKKSKIAKELDKWSEQQRTEAKEREQARMQRHKEKMERQDKAIEVYKEQMEKLLEKL
ncbi:uncharacterized protein LOC143905893 [Temnothorax americanus]|uniref:uncharacterized protein LOC143905893 n=1 Tax=Temnothorax americanus TaxID=1964332 RepID=UPI00406836C4